MSASLGLAISNIQNMQTSGFPHLRAILRVLLLAGTSFYVDGTIRRFWGCLYVSLRLRGVLSRAGTGRGCLFFVFRADSKYLPRRSFFFCAVLRNFGKFLFLEGHCHKVTGRYIIWLLTQGPRLYCLEQLLLQL